MVTGSLQIAGILVIDGRNYPSSFERSYLKKKRTFPLIFIAFLESAQKVAHFEKKDQLHSLNISEVINPDKCAYFNFGMLLL